MKNLNITTGQQYKVKNKETKQEQILNAQELANFVFKNEHTKYEITNANRTLLDKTPEAVLWAFLFVLTVAAILLYIQLNY